MLAGLLFFVKKGEFFALSVLIERKPKSLIIFILRKFN